MSSSYYVFHELKTICRSLNGKITSSNDFVILKPKSILKFSVKINAQIFESHFCYLNSQEGEKYNHSCSFSSVCALITLQRWAFSYFDCYLNFLVIHFFFSLGYL